MNIQGKISEIAKESVGRIADMVAESVANDAGSEIEKLLMAAFIIRSHIPSARIPVLMCDRDRSRSIDDVVEEVSEAPISIYVFPQVRCGSYRADFIAAAMCRRTTLTLCIECDGHDFHERTKEQAARDKSRDRFFVSHDIPVMRFSGSEIWKNALSCADQVIKYFEMAISKELRLIMKEGD